MFNKLNVDKEKFIAKINPIFIYAISVLLIVLSVIFCDKLYASESQSRFIWALICVVLSIMMWLTAVTGFYSYIYAFKYDVKKSIVFVAICYLLIIIGIVSFYIVLKIMP
ncbi:MAG: hypothetical protein CVV56_08455 [Tenericutes bacterium HGW-Tenericutes-1]|jgi:VIT1/CCC1 family predicted Fe2+/Mn2+ transporter|nr:MAG: hypothetical protein CVV58_00050 [Tenericutes bacterium HGW-Tenericutes-3]PKK99973.1 MAG: hypothetical protein CVV56_08455 [Tenericutes bacterium HGW-Tenericutes-1]